MTLPSCEVDAEVIEARITLAAVAGAHGLGGEVRVKLFGESLDSLKRHRVFHAGERVLTLLSARGGALPVLRFAEVGDRNAAEALRGQLLSVPRSALPPLAQGEYYHADIIGRPCVGSDGAALGTVVAIENFGAGDIVEVEKIDGKRAMVPFKPGIADLQGETIVIDSLFLI